MSRMFAFEFFQGASIALFFTSAFSLFLEFLQREQLPISELAKVFILSAFLLWFFGWLYARLEHLLTVKQITLSVLLFNAFSILAFRYFVSENEPSWFYYLMLAWFNVTYLLNNLEFWGLTSRLFDVRQSRRLFAIVSAGDIPAKFLGYFAAIVVIPLIGSHELLWIAAASSLFSLVFFHRLISLNAFQAELSGSHDTQGSHQPAGARVFYNLIAGNKLIRQVALISFFTLCCFLIVNFVFYGYVKEEFQSDKSLAVFIAWFLAASRACTLILKLLFTNRIADRYGIRRSLLITPVILAIVCIFSFMPSIFGNQHAAFYLFGIMAIIIDVLRSAIQSPVLLSTMQPLPLHQRLQGHTIMKGVMDPFAFFFVGTLLFSLYYIQGGLDLRLLSFVIIVTIALWIKWIFSADKNYLQTLTQAIKNRSLNEREILITDAESIEVLRRRISGGDESDAVFVLHLLNQQSFENKNELILLGLQHPSALVRQEAIKVISSIDKKEAAHYLSELIKTEPDVNVLAGSIKMLPSVEKVVDVTPYLAHHDPIIAGAAITGILSNGISLHTEAALRKLKQFHASEVILERQCAAKIIGEVKDDSLLPLLFTLLRDADSEVASMAMKAACQFKNPGLAELLLKTFAGRNKSGIMSVISSCGPSVIPVVMNFIRSNPQAVLVRKLIMILGKIEGKDAQQALDQLVEELPQHRDVLLHSLHQSGFHATGVWYPKYYNLTQGYMNAAAQIIFKIRFLQHAQEESLVAEALQLELDALRDTLLESFALLYDSGKIYKAAAGLKINSRDSVANALELIDQVADKEFSRPFICIYENRMIEDKCAELTLRFGEPYLSLQIIYRDILRDKSSDYYPWTKACVIYKMTKSKEAVDPVLVSPLQYSTNVLLRETATFAVSRNSERNFSGIES